MVEKLARGTARLAFWRTPDEASPDAAAPAAASASIAPKPGWFARLKQKLQRGKDSAALASAAVPVQAVVATAAPPPVEASEVAQANSLVADRPAAEMDSPQLEPELESVEIAQPETAQAEAPQANLLQPEAAAVTAQSLVEAAPEEGDASHTPKLVSRLLGTLSKKWVWIPSVSVAMLAVMGTLSFMLMQSKQATHELQAELASAKKQLKQMPIKPEMVPPLLVAHRDVAPHDVNHAEALPKDVSHAEASPQAAAGSSPSSNVDMDCAISDKASVAKNLRNCIEAFNQATVR